KPRTTRRCLRYGAGWQPCRPMARRWPSARWNWQGHRRACESAEEEIRGVDAEIGRLPADALQRAEGLRRQIAQNEKDASAAREDRRQAEADARALRAQAPYSSLVLAEEPVGSR